MKIGGCQIYDYLLPRHVEAARLEGRYRPQQAFLYRRIGQTYQVDADAKGDVYFNSYRYCVDTYAFSTMNIDYHNLFEIDSCEIAVKLHGDGFIPNLNQMFVSVIGRQRQGKAVVPKSGAALHFQDISLCRKSG